jgi:hypothetical protein
MDTVWRIAQDHLYHQTGVTPHWVNRRTRWGYIFAEFPQVIADMVEGKSCISCEFPTGIMYDYNEVQRILDQDHGLHRVCDLIGERAGQLVQTKIALRPPLPPTWRGLQQEKLIREQLR